MLYAWEDPSKLEKQKSPVKFSDPLFTFSALVPVRNEEKVIGDTIRAISNINYPEELKEILVLCRADDQESILEVNKTITNLGKDNIRLLVLDDLPINKPHSLNIGLKNIQNRIIKIPKSDDQPSFNIYNVNHVITVFDAEDQPHRDIYNIVNTLMTSEAVDVVQSGVQLMNFRSRWFSSINVLEYFFWFKSGLHFFSRIGNVTPLGGNTVFIKKDYLEQINGWDENCLTEDADLGIRLANQGAKIRVVYDEQHVTKEETPDSLGSFIKQRTRWNHGFLQVIKKGDWKKLPQTRQKLVALYTLIAPIFQVLFILYLPFGLWIATHYKLPVLVSTFSFIPTYIFIMQIAIYFIGLKEFSKSYGLKYSIVDSFKLLIAFLPYQLILTLASLRATHRFLSNQNLWEKTSHVNAHRSLSVEVIPAYVYADN
jgi:cellulose synthase/poly-beta-1,6-N-acetylglucosamine synthase-like glycosyltransferase